MALSTGQVAASTALLPTSPAALASQATPSLAVIIPAFNEERYIEATLKSARLALKEAEKMFPVLKCELIVVDDASTDATARIARRYARVVRSGLRCIGATRNVGARSTVAQLLLFLDADTTLTPEFIRRALDAFRCPSVVGVGALIFPERRTGFCGVLQDILFFGMNVLILLAHFAGFPCFAGNCVAFRRDAFFKAGGFDEGTKTGEDFLLSLRASRLGRLRLLPLVVRTSGRRLRRLGYLGLLRTWLGATLDLLLSRPTRAYAAYR